MSECRRIDRGRCGSFTECHHQHPMRHFSRSKSIFKMIDSSIPSTESIRHRNTWLYNMGTCISKEDVLGIKDGDFWYSLLPLSRVWDWTNIPYDPPISAGDWYIIIQGMPESPIKDQFLSDLAYSLIGHIDDSSIQEALNTMKDNNLTLTFDISTNTYEIV